MPVAASQKDSQIVQYHQLLPKPPSCHAGHLTSNFVPSPENLCGAESVALMPEGASQLASLSAAVSGVGESQGHYISTHSPPILNLSPNLSPTEPQRTSPFYDLRESTRRRSIQDLHSNLSQQMQHSPQIYSGIITDDPTRKSESPSRKRRKTSGTIVDLTNSPSPPPSSQRDAILDAARSVRRRSSTQRRVPGERCTTPRARRSPGTRRRTARERNTLRQSESPERRAFQPPVLTGRQLHPAAVLPGQSPQHPVVIDVDQVQVSAPVTMTPYAIPVCTGPHHMPVCSAAHMQMCNTQPTWSIPACTVQLPSCSMQHIPACSLQQMPVPHTIPPILHHTHHPPPHHPMPHHHGLTHTGHAQFPHVPQPQMRDEDVQIIAEHRPHYPIPTSIHPGATLNPSPPVILQEPVVHPTPHDIYMGPYQRYYARRAAGRSRLRGSLPPPPPPYPGFLLHFLAMLGNPPVPPYGRDPPDEATEENYEALLSLAERLGEAKPRGLSKADIKQLPAYYFNSETPRSDLDQTSCVVCMCDFESRQLLRVLPCGHEFHTKCVDKWLKTNRTCPICRADATDMAGNHSE
ncbi:E3 ubiquitin-protein ligase RNF38-like isoform X3 [Haliotis asinina]|uniref:E3 ubiquitin-protein ligase RNF38-like isoform X3 n=2 Tax=Haliotis asinina TaxID=109174 RepID=UPI003531A3D6